MWPHKTGCFALWFPKHAQLYSEAQLRMHLLDNLLRQHLPNLQFAGVTINAGPKTVCHWHRDCRNLAFGVCCIGVFGDFNYKESGQLLLKELKLILQLAPGDLVFIPSAVITHRNMAIGQNETRQSIVFYSAGAMFRWVAQGHVTLGNMDEHARTALQRASSGRWDCGWNLFQPL